MKRIKTEIFASSEKKGYYNYVGQRKAIDVFKDLEEILKEENLYPSEYFRLNSELTCEGAEFPNVDDMICYTHWSNDNDDNSSGIYLEVDLQSFKYGIKKPVITHFATGRSLDESTESFDRMQYITGYIYRLFRGDGSAYISLKMNMESLIERVNAETIQYIKQGLFNQKDGTLWECADEMSRSLTILKALSKCQLPKDRVLELHVHMHILSYLLELCSNLKEPSVKTIEDFLMSCDTFV